MIDQVTSELGRLPEPAPPSTLAATVMARVARLPEPEALPAPGERGRARIAARREWPAWAWALSGVVVVFAAHVYDWRVAGRWPDLMSSRIGGVLPAVLPVEGLAAPILALGLVLYLAGLFAPLRRT
jgi:hypothetical protein